MAELFLELFLGFLAFIGFRKRKKHIEVGYEAQKETLYAGCRRGLKKQIIYEGGKTGAKTATKLRS